MVRPESTKEVSAIEVRELLNPKVTEVKLSHPKKALLPMVVTESGITMLLAPISLNEEDPIVSSVLPLRNITDVTFWHIENA